MKALVLTVVGVTFGSDLVEVGQICTSGQANFWSRTAVIKKQLQVFLQGNLNTYLSGKDPFFGQ